MADSLFPFIDATVADTSTAADTTIPTEYAWDFEANEFVLQNGRPMIVTGAAAVRMWIMKTLLTERYRYLAYSWAYGHEFDALVGESLSPEARKAEAERYLEEALTVNPHVTGVTDVETAFDGSRLGISFTAETDQGEVDASV